MAVANWFRFESNLTDFMYAVLVEAKGAESTVIADFSRLQLWVKENEETISLVTPFTGDIGSNDDGEERLDM